MQLQEAATPTPVQELRKIRTCSLGKLIHNTVRPLNNAHLKPGVILLL